jgi:small-conductance mechanosensitive channel
MIDTLKRLLTTPGALRALEAVAAIAVILLAARLLRNTLGSRIQDVDVRYRARKSVTFLSYLLAILVVIAIFSRQIGGASVALGVTGAGIAFALQEVIASVAGWIAVSLGGFYSTGDRIQLGGIKGDVIDISILRTTIMEVGEWVASDLYTGRIVRVTNSFVFKEPVFNYSADFPFLWDEATLPIRYGSDWKYARETLHGVVQEVLSGYAGQVRSAWQEAARRYRVQDTNVEPMITLRTTENWIEFTIRYVVDYRKRRWMKDYLFTRILEEVDKSEGRIRLASATFELVQDSKLQVELQREDEPRP